LQRVKHVWRVRGDTMKKILRFTASWCGPCKALANTLKDEDIGLPIEVIDIDDDAEVAIKYNIRSVPTLVIEDDGKEVSRITGARPLDQLKKWVIAYA